MGVKERCVKYAYLRTSTTDTRVLEPIRFKTLRTETRKQGKGKTRFSLPMWNTYVKTEQPTATDRTDAGCCQPGGRGCAVRYTDASVL